MKKPIILWIVAALFLFCSVPFFGQGSIIEGVCGIAIAAALGVFGYVTMKRTQAAELAKKDTENEEAPVALNDEIAPSECSGNLEAQQDSSYEFLRTKIAGVTFKDGRKSRQTIIRRLYWKDEPFDKNEAEVVLERGEYEGKPAFAVILNGQKAGYVPAEHVQFIEENFAGCDGVRISKHIAVQTTFTALKLLSVSESPKSPTKKAP